MTSLVSLSNVNACEAATLHQNRSNPESGLNGFKGNFLSSRSPVLEGRGTVPPASITDSKNEIKAIFYALIGLILAAGIVTGGVFLIRASSTPFNLGTFLCWSAGMLIILLGGAAAITALVFSTKELQ